MDSLSDQSLPALVVRGLTKRFESALAVDDLSFSVEGGQILGLLGPNGAGKTTTLRSIAGVLPIQQGTVLIAGNDITHDETKAKSCLAWVPFSALQRRAIVCSNPQSPSLLTIWGIISAMGRNSSNCPFR